MAQLAGREQSERTALSSHFRVTWGSWHLLLLWARCLQNIMYDRVPEGNEGETSQCPGMHTLCPGIFRKIVESFLPCVLDHTTLDQTFEGVLDNELRSFLPYLRIFQRTIPFLLF